MGLVVYIHGIGRHAPPEQLKREWDLALFGREMGEQTVMAYWADILHGEAVPPKSPKRAKRVQADTLDVDALLREAGVDATNADARFVAHSVLRSLGVESPAARTRVLPLPAFLRKPVARAFLEAFVKDTAAYFFRRGVREKVQARLAAVLGKLREPVTLVAHSQGSVISLEVLAAAAQKTPHAIANFVTIGSPLGLREVQDFLACPLAVPQGVAAWNNFADPVDPVALDKGIGNDFDPAGFIVDELLVNRRTSTAQGFNPHSSVGYLAHPKVRRCVHLSARFDPHARFLVARDVAAELGIEARQSVLIEILEPGYPALGETRAAMCALEATEQRGAPTLAARIEAAARQIEQIVGRQALPAARVDRLRRFVAARLTPAEIAEIARRHCDLRVYALWKSTVKRKLIHRSARVIQADAARASYGAAGEGVRWAVLDTGVRSDHPHFATHGTIEEIWDCTKTGPPQRLTSDRDADGHGTHVAGIIAGESPPDAAAGPHRAGMAPRARLVVYKVLDDAGAGEDAWIIKALDHITERNEQGAEIAIHGINLSLGGPYDATVYGCGFTPICVELRRQWRAGVLVCVASGNEGQVQVSTPGGALELNSPMSIGDPANLEDCIAVGSVNADRPHLHGVSAFSSRGPTSDGRVKPDVVAPGERIESCNARWSKQAGDLYVSNSGTSMAAPHVSGLLAAFLSARREFRGRPDEVKALLLRTATDIGRDRYHQGHGVPNLMRMLMEL
jgi:hypothetical protein